MPGLESKTKRRRSHAYDGRGGTDRGMAGRLYEAAGCRAVDSAFADAAFQRFAELGFPTTREEEWRFTNVAPIARTRFQAASEPWGYNRSASNSSDRKGIRLEFVNGRLFFRPEELPKGVLVGSLLENPE